MLHKRFAVTIDLPSWHGATCSTRTPSVQADGAIALFSEYLQIHREPVSKQNIISQALDVRYILHLHNFKSVGAIHENVENSRLNPGWLVQNRFFFFVKKVGEEKVSP